ncbi:M28 family metallopeptidase [Novosphingobium sp.]|uniref:M28 family metallopeptidase n=1 Tax=Novosphingobium sp. TaxID=1874826 RepID=UPI0031D0331B
MRRHLYSTFALAGLMLAGAAGAQTSTPAAAPAPGEAPKVTALWAVVKELADDSYQGRGAGSPGYDRAAAWLVKQLQAIGLEPAGTNGFYQPVDLVAQRFDAAASRAQLLSGTGGVPLAMPLSVPNDIYFRGAHAMPVDLTAPLVFAGYGLSMPDAGHDDFAGIDVKGKIVVVVPGGPENVSGARKANARSERTTILAKLGAVGLIQISTPKQTEIPWARQIGLSARPSLMLKDDGLRDVAAPFLAAMVNPEKGEALLAGSGHSFAEVAALADKSAALPHFDLATRLSTHIAASQTVLHSANIVARLPGSDPALGKQNVVVSAHLDGLGVGEPVKGDAIYNGALDNGVGVASALTIARDLKAGKRPRRSVLFLFPTAEEGGLLGSRYFAMRPSVPKASLVADINFDMPLPIFPLTSVTPIGYEESSLGKDAAAVSAKMGLPIVPDPFPDRNVFIRSDQYSFIRAGVPSLFMKLGFKRDTPEAEVEKAWRAGVYHSPRDDANQPVIRPVAAAFADYVTAVVRHVADAAARPAWNKDSYFGRFSGK